MKTEDDDDNLLFIHNRDERISRKLYYSFITEMRGLAES
jgi:hypothetical protein